MHHSEIIRPVNIPADASFNAFFEGYVFIYSWIVFENIENDFVRLYSYDYEGNLKDSIFAHAYNLELQPNYYFNEDYQSLVLYNNSCKQKLFVDHEPFQGYGSDKGSSILETDLHCLEKGKHLKQIFMTIFNGYGKSFPNYRNAKALSVLNSTIKSIGYDKFLTKEDYLMPRLSVSEYGVGFNQNLSISEFIDSLLLYSNTDKANQYYDEFWERRRNEETQNAVISILKDIKKYYDSDISNIDRTLINDTLKICFTYDFRFQNADNIEEQGRIVEDYYNQLVRFGLNQSAFNLMFNSPLTRTLGANKTSIIEGLEIKESAYSIDGKQLYLNKNKPKWIKSTVHKMLL